MELIAILNISLVCLVVIVMVLIVAYVLIRMKSNKEESDVIATKTEKIGTTNGLTKEHIHNFIEFDEIKDDMIIRKNGEQYVMVIQCKGINYDLMAEDEKIAVEQGFVQFLNTLRGKVQLYVQTRSLNLRNTLDEYKQRVDKISDDIRKLSNKRQEQLEMGNRENVEKLTYEIRRKQNVLEYGNDISDYVGRMSLNKNVLQQKTYIVVSYFASEAGGIGNYSKDEFRNICFSELYTRCQTVMSSLAATQVSGRILDSEELAELLYIAYNRDDSEIYQLSKALEGQYNALYSTGKDILKKKEEKLKEEIDYQAIELATESIINADKKLKDKREIEALVKKRALEVISDYKEQMEPELYEETQKEIEGKFHNESIENGRKERRTRRRRKTDTPMKGEE